MMKKRVRYVRNKNCSFCSGSQFATTEKENEERRRFGKDTYWCSVLEHVSGVR